MLFVVEVEAGQAFSYPWVDSSDASAFSFEMPVSIQASTFSVTRINYIIRVSPCCRLAANNLFPLQFARVEIYNNALE